MAIDKIKWTILNDRLRKCSVGIEPDYDGFIHEARNWPMDTDDLALAWGTVIVLTEMQCELFINSQDDASDARGKSEQAHQRWKLLQRLREQLPSIVLEYMDAAKRVTPKSMVEKMPWLS